MDFLDSTINNCSFASGRSVSLNSSLCHSPTTTTAAIPGGFATPTTTTTAANRSSHSNRFAPSPASMMSANNNRSQHQRAGSGYQSPAYSPASDRFVSYSDRFLHEEGGGSQHHHSTGAAAQVVDIFPSPSFGLGRRGGGVAATSNYHHPASSSSQQRRSLTFSPTRSEMAGSLALRTPLYRCGRGGAAGAEEGDEDIYLSNTARSIFSNNDDDGFRSVTSPQGAGRASTGDEQLPTQSSNSFLCPPSSSSLLSSTTTTRRHQQQNPLLDLYTLEASHQEWSSAIAAATSPSATTGDHGGGATSGGVSSPLMVGPLSFRSSTAASSPPRAGGGRQQQQGSGEGNDHATASDYIRAMEEAAASNGSPHLATAISSPGASAAQAIRSLASGEGPERYISSLANVLLTGHTSSSSSGTRRGRGADHFVDSSQYQEGICVQSPLNPIKRSQFLSCPSPSSPVHQYPDENAVVVLPAAGDGGGRRSQASLFASSDALTYNRNKGRHFQTATFRTIPQTPERILDAPELVDDFYLNLLDWSAKNVLTVALSNTCYLWNAANGSITQLMTTNAVDNVITAVAWHRVGDVLAIGLSSGEISIWNTKTEKCLHTVSSHTGRVCSLGWHGYLLASGSRDTTIIINNLEGVVEADYQATQLNNNGLSSSGSSSSSSGSSPFTGAGVVLQGHTQEVCGLEWSPDGTQLASGGNDNILCIWNVKKDTLEITLGWQFSEHTAAIKAIAWNPVRSHCLVTGGGTADKTLRVWNTHTGVRTHLVDTKSQVCGIVWNNDGTEFVSSHGFSDNQLTIWRFPTMKKLADLTGHTSRVLHLAKSPDGEMVVSAAGDETIRFWRCFAPITPAEGGGVVGGGGVRSAAKGSNNPSASAEVQDDAAGEEAEASRQEHASEVAAIVAAVQRDLSRQSRQSRAQHHYQTPPSTTTTSCFGTGRAGVISPTTSGTTYPSFQRPPTTTRPNNTATAVAIEDSVENELLGLTRCVSSDSRSTTNINYKWASTNASSLSPIPPHVCMDPTTATTSILAADTAARGGGVPPTQRGSSPLSISSLSPVQQVTGVVGAPSYYRSMSPVSDPSSFYMGVSFGGTTKQQHQHLHTSGISHFPHNYSTTKQQQRGSGGGGGCTREPSVGGFGGPNSNNIVVSSWDAPPLFGPTSSSYTSSSEANHHNSDTVVPPDELLAWSSGGGSLLGGFSAAPIGECR